jgi:preprotein translocase subunit YajC
MKFLSRFGVLLLFSSLAFAQQPGDQQGRQGGPRGGMFFGMGSAVHGTVTAISGSEYTIKTEDGTIYKIATGPNTHIMKDRQPIKASDIHAGDVVMTGGEVDDNAHTVGAVFLAVLDAEQVARMKQMQADFGKTWTAGKITAINDLTLTIERPDKKTQTIAVDENTSFQKHRESITLADIKVGDTVASRGALKDGNFVATELTVVEPRNRPLGAGPNAAPQPPQ